MLYTNEVELNQFITDNIHKGHHVFIVGGNSGVGKTHSINCLAKSLGMFLISIDSNVSEVREVLQSGLENMSMRYMVCVENVDTGVSGVQLSLLKSIEEYSENIYWVITCRNLKYVQETILSRGITFNMSDPSVSDITEFAKSRANGAFDSVKGSPMWKAVRSFADVNMVTYLFDQDRDKFDYFNNLVNIDYRESVSNLSYKIQHYPDKSKIPLDFLFKFIIANTSDSTIKYVAIQHLRELERLNSYVVVNHFLFTVKYALRY